MTTHWQTSTFCANAGCVGVAEVKDGAAMTDTKLKDGPFIVLQREVMKELVQRIKAGEFDGSLDDSAVGHAIIGSP